MHYKSQPNAKTQKSTNVKSLTKIVLSWICLVTCHWLQTNLLIYLHTVSAQTSWECYGFVDSSSRAEQSVHICFTHGVVDRDIQHRRQLWKARTKDEMKRETRGANGWMKKLYSHSQWCNQDHLHDDEAKTTNIEIHTRGQNIIGHVEIQYWLPTSRLA